MQDFILRLGVQFSDEDKQKCLPIARRMVYLAHASYEQGILGLEDEVVSDSPFMKMGVNLTILR